MSKKLEDHFFNIKKKLIGKKISKQQFDYILKENRDIALKIAAESYCKKLSNLEKKSTDEITRVLSSINYEKTQVIVAEQTRNEEKIFLQSLNNIQKLIDMGLPFSCVSYSPPLQFKSTMFKLGTPDILNCVKEHNGAVIFLGNEGDKIKIENILRKKYGENCLPQSIESDKKNEKSKKTINYSHSPKQTN